MHISPFGDRYIAFVFCSIAKKIAETRMERERERNITKEKILRVSYKHVYIEVNICMKSRGRVQRNVTKTLLLL